MKARLNAFSAAPAAMQSFLAFGQQVGGLEHALMELVKIRASQINGCAYCLHMHTRDARAAGESEARLYLLDAWRESPSYSERERAALGWTEALTRMTPEGASDEAWAALSAHFTDEEKVNLTLLIGVINMWNRINVGFRVPHPVASARAA